MVPRIVNKNKTYDNLLPLNPERPNFVRKFQVIPPCRVDLTLAPKAFDEIRVPVDISGRNLFSKSSRKMPC